MTESQPQQTEGALERSTDNSATREDTPGPASDTPTIVVVDDDRIIHRVTDACLTSAGYAVTTFDSAEACLSGLSQILPDVILLDVSLPGMSGLETLETLRRQNEHLPVVMLTADTAIDTVMTATQLGAYDYLTKPIDRNKLVTTVRNAVEHSRLSVRLKQLEREVEGAGYPNIIGSSPAMRQLYRQLDRLSSSDVSVLIHGESGSGKELVARAIHDSSGRSSGPFVALNCAAIPSTLQESELFGYEKGAFTGAMTQRIGRFEQADGGTLFLDEIGELSLELQAKLLRAIQERSFSRVGGNAEIQSNFRLLTATHKPLRDLVIDGGFREDFYFRIAVYDLQVPPLRERQEDIVPLAQHFIAKHASKGRTPRLSEAARRLVTSYSWPGNVRELENAIQRALVASSNDLLGPNDLPRSLWSEGQDFSLASAILPEEEVSSGAPSSVIPVVVDERPLSMEEIEREAIVLAVARCEGNMAQVVRELCIGRSTLYRKLKKYGIDY